MIRKLAKELTKKIRQFDEWSYAYIQGNEIHVCNDGVCDALVYDIDRARIIYEPEQRTIDDKILAYIAKEYLVSNNML